MFNIIVVIFGLIICGIHIKKYGLEDKYDVDILIILVLLIVLFVYNVIRLFVWRKFYGRSPRIAPSAITS